MRCPRAAVEPLILMLAPIAPHICEELWNRLGHTASLAHESWPVADERYVGQDTITAVVQIKGKVRAKLEVSPDIDPAELERMALEAVADRLGGKTPRKVIVKAPKIVTQRSTVIDQGARGGDTLFCRIPLRWAAFRAWEAAHHHICGRDTDRPTGWRWITGIVRPHRPAALDFRAVAAASWRYAENGCRHITGDGTTGRLGAARTAALAAQTAVMPATGCRARPRA